MPERGEGSLLLCSQVLLKVVVVVFCVANIYSGPAARLVPTVLSACVGHSHANSRPIGVIANLCEVMLIISRLDVKHAVDAMSCISNLFIRRTASIISPSLPYYLLRLVPYLHHALFPAEGHLKNPIAVAVLGNSSQPLPLSSSSSSIPPSR